MKSSKINGLNDNFLFLSWNPDTNNRSRLPFNASSNNSFRFSTIELFY